MSLPVLMVLVAVLANVPTVSHAYSRQVVLLGLPGPAGSMSQAGSTDTVVHLWWDVIDGQLPAGIIGLELRRDGALLTTLPVLGTMNAASIQALYDGPKNERRAFEMRRWLSEALVGIDVGPADLGQAIFEMLETNEFWAHLAAHVDINVAVARYRGFIDEAPVTGAAEYVLLGFDSKGSPTELGRVTVKASAPYVPASATNFHQVPLNDLRRCDAPEDFKAHGVVALDWQQPGATAPARTAHGLAIAGYDIYRSNSNTASAPPRDLRNEASQLPHDASGRVTFPGLTKVNDQPIIFASGLAAKLREGRLELTTSGVRPGDIRAYYLVARDLRGHYGETTSTLVTVPDLLPPPTPWRVRAHARPTPNRIVLRWPAIGVASYVSQHPRRKWCNLNTAQSTGRLRFTQDDACPVVEESAPAVNLDIASYRVYRFSSARGARAFVDSDGDGHSDRGERADISTPGPACDPNVVGGGLDLLAGTVPAIKATVTPSGRAMLIFDDTVPAQQPGQVYWYRVAAVTTSGLAGPLSAPVRAMFPDVLAPPRSDLGTSRIGVCNPEVDVIGLQGLFVLGRDETRRADQLELSCTVENGKTYRERRPLVAGLNGWGYALGMSPATCSEFTNRCHQKDVRVRYLTDRAKVLGERIISAWGNGIENPVCASMNTRFYRNCDQIVDVEWGQPTDDVVIDVDYTGDDCVGVYLDIGGKSQRLALECDGAFPITLDLSPLGSEPVCISLAVVDNNNRVSPQLPLDCFRIPQDRAEAPQPLSFSFTAAQATGTVSFRPPEQTVVGTIVEWSLQSGSFVQSRFIPQPSSPALDRSVTAEVDLTPFPAAGTQEEWCFRARTVVSGTPLQDIEDTLSDWSVSICGLRQAASVPAPDYIPWPSIPSPPHEEALTAAYLPLDALPVVMIGSLDPGCPPGTSPTCSKLVNCQLESPVVLESECQTDCTALKAALAPDLRFVVYRQERDDGDDTPSNYVQVSPRIDRIHCWGKDYPAHIADPYLSLITVTTGEPVSSFLFVDRYPHTIGLQYRYQLVYFDDRGEIVRYRTSGWVFAGDQP